MSKIAIIGAGASGIMAAVSIPEGNRVFLLDQNDKIAKKILMTGNGKCNYWHDDISVLRYNTDNKDCLNKLLEYQDATFNYLNKLGIYPYIKDGYYYPMSESSNSIKKIFEDNINKKNIEVKYNYKVEKIEKEADHYVINDDLKVDKIIFATGGKCYPKTGSDGSGYNLLAKYDVQINKVYPSLAKLLIKDLLNKADGVRCNCNLKLFIDGNQIGSNYGNVQFTNNALSGICIFNLSTFVTRNLDKRVTISLDFAPKINDFEKFLNERNIIMKNPTIRQMLESLFNYKLLNVLLEKCGVEENDTLDNITQNKKDLLIKSIKNYEVNILGTSLFDDCQVCSGGVSLNEINPRTMQLKKHENIYVIGEVLDADGICGGYNLAFAFITGFIAGTNINQD